MPRSEPEDDDKPCRACSDFKSWAKQQSKTTLAPNAKPDPPNDCPLDKEDLGKSTWGFLHSMAAYYPDKPTSHQSTLMCQFFKIFAQFYPCEPCALDFQKDTVANAMISLPVIKALATVLKYQELNKQKLCIEKNPPMTDSREELGKWLCDRHNEVNQKLGKPLFDCSKIQERWRDGWKDGSCD